MPSRESLLERIAPSQEKRHWVRLTRACNNRCIFCLDSDCQDGSFLDFESVMEDIGRGIEEGARRLVLSGGEPTIHPRFVQIIQASVKMGYRWIQAISNGRRFAYPGFTAGAVRAGLNEVTVSMHGHDAALHDAMTRVSGSFVQSIAGIRNLFRSGRCHVSVDVVMNAKNIDHLVEIIEVFAGLGVREFDLLMIQPFGRAWHGPGLMLEKSHSPRIREGVRRARELGCWVWTNRVPPEYLEGMEDMIQDPVKLLDDIRGRREFFRRHIKSGSVPDCYGDKCAYCALRGFCGYYLELLNVLGITGAPDRLPDHLRISACPDRMRSGFVKELVRKYRPGGEPGKLKLVIGENFRDSVLETADRISRSSHLDLLIHRSPAHRLPYGARRVKSVAVEPELAHLAPRFHDGCEKAVIVRKGLDPSALPSRIESLVYLPHGDIAEELERGPDLQGIGRRDGEMKMIGVPPCLSRNRSSWPSWPYIDESWFDEDLLPDPLKFAESFISDLCYTKAGTCEECMFNETCRGIHVNYVRKFGYGVLKPVTGGSPGTRKTD